MTKRFHTSARLELKLPLTVIESCRLMGVNSEICLAAISSDSVRVNVILEKSKDHVKFIFSAYEGIPYLEALSDHYKCSIEAVLGPKRGSENENWRSKDVHRDPTRLDPTTRCQTLATRVTREHDLYDCGDNLGFKDVIVPPVSQQSESANGHGTEPLSGDVQVKEEFSEKLPEWQTSDFDASHSVRSFCALKAEQDSNNFNNNASKLVEDDDNVSDSNSDTISLSPDELKDEECFLVEARPNQQKAQKTALPQKLPTALKLKPVKAIDKLKLAKQGMCPYCGVYYGNLSQHIFTYCSKNPERIRAFHCCYCKFKTQSKEELVEHKTTHVLLRDFKCEICDSGFFTRQRLIRHMRYVHLVGNNPVKIYTCNDCNKRFRYRSHYDRHLTIHQEEKSVQCEMCGKFFKNKHNVHNHQSRMHPLKASQMTYPYYCEKCGAGFLHLGSHRCSEPRRPRVRNNSLQPSQEQSMQTPNESTSTVKRECLSTISDL